MIHFSINSVKLNPAIGSPVPVEAGRVVLGDAALYVYRFDE